MFIAMNRFRVALGGEQALAGESHALHSSFTAWTSKAGSEIWIRSEAFAATAGHRNGARLVDPRERPARSGVAL